MKEVKGRVLNNNRPLYIFIKNIQDRKRQFSLIRL